MPQGKPSLSYWGLLGSGIQVCYNIATILGHVQVDLGRWIECKKRNKILDELLPLRLPPSHPGLCPIPPPSVAVPPILSAPTQMYWMLLGHHYLPPATVARLCRMAGHILLHCAAGMHVLVVQWPEAEEGCRREWREQ